MIPTQLSSTVNIIEACISSNIQQHNHTIAVPHIVLSSVSFPVKKWSQFPMSNLFYLYNLHCRVFFYSYFIGRTFCVQYSFTCNYKTSHVFLCRCQTFNSFGKTLLSITKSAILYIFDVGTTKWLLLFSLHAMFDC